MPTPTLNVPVNPPPEPINEPTPSEEATGAPSPEPPYYTRRGCRNCGNDIYVLNGADPLCVKCGGTVG